MKGIADFAKETVEQIAALDKEQLRPERVELGLCPRCGAETGENQSRRTPRHTAVRAGRAERSRLAVL